MLGDNHSRVAHLVGEVLGANGLIKEIIAKDKKDAEKGAEELVRCCKELENYRANQSGAVESGEQ